MAQQADCDIKRSSAAPQKNRADRPYVSIRLTLIKPKFYKQHYYSQTLPVLFCLCRLIHLEFGLH